MTGPRDGTSQYNSPFLRFSGESGLRFVNVTKCGLEVNCEIIFTSPFGISEFVMPHTGEYLSQKLTNGIVLLCFQ